MWFGVDSLFKFFGRLAGILYFSGWTWELFWIGGTFLGTLLSLHLGVLIPLLLLNGVLTFGREISSFFATPIFFCEAILCWTSLSRFSFYLCFSTLLFSLGSKWAYFLLTSVLSFSRSAYRNVFKEWSAEELPGEMQAIITILDLSFFPRKESLKIRVSLEALKGIWSAF